MEGATALTERTTISWPSDRARRPRLSRQADPAPDQFIPVLTNWSARSIFIGRVGQVEFFHYDLLGQAMSKIERGHDRDLADVDEMVSRGLVSLSDVEAYFESVEARLVRYPAIDRGAFAQKIATFLERKRGT